MFTDPSGHSHSPCSTMSLRTYISLPQLPEVSGLHPPVTNSLDSRLSRDKKKKVAPAPDSGLTTLWFVFQQLPSYV